MIELEATQLHNCWVIRPKGQLGTCGFYPVPWTVIITKAHSAEEAIAKARTTSTYAAMRAKANAKAKAMAAPIIHTLTP